MMTNNQNNRTSFHAFDVSLELARAVRDLLPRIEMADPDLGRQVRKAVTSSPLNVLEANRRTGRDRVYRFRIAMGSADEVRAALLVADALGYLRRDEVEPALALADRVVAMLWRLTSPPSSAPTRATSR